MGDTGPAIALLHGLGDTGDMWQPRADVLTKDHTVVVPDPCGMGLSWHPEGSYEKVAQDAADNQKRLAEKGKLTMPVLAIGGNHSFGDAFAGEIGFAASNVRGAVIANSGHWIMEEQPDQAIAVILPFLRAK